MRNKIILVLLFICILSVITNVLQFNKMRHYNEQEKFYTKMFENEFNGLIQSFDYYDGSHSLSNESAIKNSISFVEDLGAIRALTSYRQSQLMSEMLLYLSQFFVLNSNEFINQNLEKIKPHLDSISKNLNDEKAIEDFNTILWEINHK